MYQEGIHWSLVSLYLCHLLIYLTCLTLTHLWWAITTLQSGNQKVQKKPTQALLIKDIAALGLIDSCV